MEIHHWTHAFYLLQMYIYLTLVEDKETKIDIRDGGVTEFIAEHKTDPAETWDRIPMVMVNGVLYMDTGRESDIMARCGMMDGEITTQVDGSKTPTMDDQSNFGTGYGYQYGSIEGTIEIFMNDKWWVFATEEVRQEIDKLDRINDQMAAYRDSDLDRINDLIAAYSDSDSDKYWLTIGEDGVKRIEIKTAYSSGGCENADGSLYQKGDRIWLECLDGYLDLRGVSFTAFAEDGQIIWQASIPDGEDNAGFTHLRNNDWNVTNIP